MSVTHDLVWASSRGKVLVGKGEIDEVDPGVGADRYERALKELRRRERTVAFASFTFDPEAPGSIVLIPESVEAAGIETALGGVVESTWGGRISSDGTEAWRRGFAESAARLEDGDIEKVVLARKVTAAFAEPPDTRQVLRRLGTANNDLYLFSMAGLVGASPELLVSLRDGEVAAHPLAGTSVDEMGLARGLIAKEHRLTADFVEDALSPHLRDGPSVQSETVDLGTIKHLGSRITGPARQGTTIADLLRDLHPTPAVGGVPTGRALELIRSVEPWGRGRYAGPVGWLGPTGEGEFAVALRCGQLGGNGADLFAGGGLVRGCDPETELEETRLKLKPMLGALGLET